MQDGSLVSWTWYALALILFVIEALRPGRFALWIGFAAVLVGGPCRLSRGALPRGDADRPLRGRGGRRCRAIADH